jgi:hypothetical protein
MAVVLGETANLTYDDMGRGEQLSQEPESLVQDFRGRE